MIVTPQIAVRVAVIVILSVLLELSFFSEVEVFHTSPTVLPSVIACLGLLGGSLTGAVTGFAAGLLLDSLLIAPLGASSLVLLDTAISPAFTASASSSPAASRRRSSAWA